MPAGLGTAILAALAAGSSGGFAVRTVPFSDLVRPAFVIVPPHGLKIPAVRAFLHVLKMRFPESDLPAPSAAVLGGASVREGTALGDSTS